MTVKERIVEYIKVSGLSVNKFEKDAGLSVGYLRQLRKEPSREKIKSIILAFPDINESWLLTGEGDMLKSETSGEMGAVNEIDSGSDMVTVLPIEAMAGTLQGFSEGVELANCPKMKSPVKGADWAIQISGDSMEPDYKNGSYLFIKRMTSRMIPWGQPLVVDTYDGVVFKKLYPYDDECIEARSINPNYPPFQIEKSIVIGLYRVLGGTFINSTI